MRLKFLLVDRITELEAGKRVSACKALSLGEEYLADHFPRFPVLPGVFLLEALVETSAWLVRVSQEFRHSLVVLKEARNVTYKSFLAPGHVLQIESVCKELGDQQSAFSASGSVDGREIVKGQFTLRHLNLADSDPAFAETDAKLRTRMRGLLELLVRGGAVKPAV